MHPELVKRAADLLMFLVTPPGCALKACHVDMLWQACASKHGALAVPIADCLCELVPALAPPLLKVCACVCVVGGWEWEWEPWWAAPEFLLRSGI